MDFASLPNELLVRIAKYFPLSDAKNLSLTSKRMQEIAKPRIWNAPRFKRISLSSLLDMSHLPIRVLRMSDIEPILGGQEDKDFDELLDEYCRAFRSMKLQRIHFDSGIFSKINFDEILKTLQSIGADIEIVFYTNVFEGAMEEIGMEDFVAIKQVLTSIKLVGVVLNHYKDTWDVDVLKCFREFPVTEMFLTCLNDDYYSGSKLLDFLTALNNPCQLDMKLHEVVYEKEGNFIDWYQFNARDLMNIVRYNHIHVSVLSTSRLDTRNRAENFEALVPILSMMNLEELDFDEFYSGDIHWKYFSHLPIKHFTTSHFALDTDEKVDEAVDALTSMKHLISLEVSSINRFSPGADFKLSPYNFKKFSLLPVKSIDLEALYINDENVHKFREIMRKMTIGHINNRIVDRTAKKYTFKEYPVYFHGPENCYKTV